MKNLLKEILLQINISKPFRFFLNGYKSSDNVVQTIENYLIKRNLKYSRYSIKSQGISVDRENMKNIFRKALSENSVVWLDCEDPFYKHVSYNNYIKELNTFIVSGGNLIITSEFQETDPLILLMNSYSNTIIFTKNF